MSKKVAFTPMENIKLIDKTSYELNKDNYQTPREFAQSLKESFSEQKDPHYYDKKRERKQNHTQKILGQLNDAGYSVKPRPDGRYNICKATGKCIIAATLGYGILHSLGLLKGGRRTKRRKPRRFTRRKNRTRSILKKRRRKNKTLHVRFKRKITIRNIGTDDRDWSCKQTGITIGKTVKSSLTSGKWTK